MNPQEIIEKLRNRFNWEVIFGKNSGAQKETENFLIQTIISLYEQELKYWKDVFDKRPKDRDLESDNIAQNFARIEIERIQSKLDKWNELLVNSK